MEYLLKASVVIAIFYLCYRLFLQKETFFNYNRWFLLSGLLVTIVIPLWVIPIYIEQPSIPVTEFIFADSNIASNTTHETLDVLQILYSIYVLGVAVFFIRFVLQCYSLSNLVIKSTKQKKGSYTYIKCNDNIAPFSFFKWIVYNPKPFKDSELKQIITHEEVHAKQLHSIDIIISELCIIAFWFNPLVWFYKKDMQQNLEFIADHAAQNISSCKKSYQYVLLKSSVPTHQLALTNNFYNSLIKKRIVMLHKSKSNRRNAWKYALVIPALALFLMSFNTKKIYVEVPLPIPKSADVNTLKTEDGFNVALDISASPVEDKTNTIKSTSSSTKEATAKPDMRIRYKNSDSNQEREMVLITKDFTEADFTSVKTRLEKEGITAKFKGIKRNADNEITAIKIDISSKQSNANYNISSDDPIKPIKISFDREGGHLIIGNASELHFDAKGYTVIREDGKHIVHKSSTGHNKVFFHSDDDEDVEVLIEKKKDVLKNKGKVHIKKDHIDKKVHIIKGDEDEIIEIDPEVEIDEDVIIIKKGKDGKIIKERITKDKHVWVDEDDNTSFRVRKIGKDKGVNVFISGDGDKEPLYILDGKEVDKSDIDEMDPENIESIDVLKGDSAIEEFGDKAKDGVVKIKTKA